MVTRWSDVPEGNLLVIGPRRSGKTTFLRQRFPQNRYATLDDIDYLKWARRDPKGFVKSLRPAAILDEIQRCPELTIAVKYWVDAGEIRVWMTGSSSLGLLDASVETLAGRIHLLHMPTLCWGEEIGPPTHDFFEGKLPPPAIAEARRAFPEAIRFGGFPEVVTRLGGQGKLLVLRQYRDTYFLRDLAQLSNIENVEGLMVVFRHLLRSIGSPVEVSHFAAEAGISHATAKRYLNVLLQSELGLKLYAFESGPAKRYAKAGKMYPADGGIATAFQEEINPGQRFEQFVISEVEKRRKLGFRQADRLMYQRSQSGAEIDLILEEPTVIRAIEIKASDRVERKDSRNLRRFLEQPSAKERRAYVVYQGDDYAELDRVQWIPVYALRGAR